MAGLKCLDTAYIFILTICRLTLTISSQFILCMILYTDTLYILVYLPAGMAVIVADSHEPLNEFYIISVLPGAYRIPASLGW